MLGADTGKFQGNSFREYRTLFPYIILKKNNPDPEYYNREEKRPKVKVRRTYNRRILGEHFQADLKQLSMQLLAKEKSQYCKVKVSAGQSSTSIQMNQPTGCSN